MSKEQRYRLTWVEHEDGMGCLCEGEVVKGTGERYGHSSTQYWIANIDTGTFEWLGYKAEVLPKLRKWLKEMKKQDAIKVTDVILHDEPVIETCRGEVWDRTQESKEWK